LGLTNWTMKTEVQVPVMESRSTVKSLLVVVAIFLSASIAMGIMLYNFPELKE